MVDVHVFEYVGGTLENAGAAYLVPATGRIVAALRPVALSGVTLHFVLMGYMVVTGAVEESFYTFLKQSAKVLLIAAFALNADTYLDAVTGAFRGLESGLAAAVDLNDAGAAGLYLGLDHSLSGGLEIVSTCFEHAGSAGISSIGAALAWGFSGVVVALGAIAVTLLGGANIILAKVAVVVLFSVGPLFVMSLMWPVTARFFDSWFGQVLNYVLTVVILAVLMAFAMRAFQHFVEAADFEGGAVNPLIAALQILVLSLVLGFLMLQASSMAAGLAGGLSVAALAVRHLATPPRALKGALNPVSTRRDAQTGQKVAASRVSHIVAGNTFANPRYRQALLGQLGRNWGSARGGSAKKA